MAFRNFIHAIHLQPVRKVTLNTSLPTASPTFQRAMLNLRSSEVNGTEIMSQKRRDSILQNYQLTETVLSSFRDDNDLSKVGARSDTLEVMTNRFREDMKEYKSGWSPREQGKVRKSILKKRRQSVDDMEISTRKNLAKYLESKLNIDDDDKRHDKMVGFH